MNKIENIKQAIMYFLKKAEEDYFPIGKVRITKFLCPLDLEYYRDHGKTFTGFKRVSTFSFPDPTG